MIDFEEYSKESKRLADERAEILLEPFNVVLINCNKCNDTHYSNETCDDERNNKELFRLKIKAKLY